MERDLLQVRGHDRGHTALMMEGTGTRVGTNADDVVGINWGVMRWLASLRGRGAAGS